MWNSEETDSSEEAGDKTLHLTPAGFLELRGISNKFSVPSRAWMSDMAYGSTGTKITCATTEEKRDLQFMLGHARDFTDLKVDEQIKFFRILMEHEPNTQWEGRVLNGTLDLLGFFLGFWEDLETLASRLSLNMECQRNHFSIMATDLQTLLRHTLVANRVASKFDFSSATDFRARKFIELFSFIYGECTVYEPGGAQQRSLPVELRRAVLNNPLLDVLWLSDCAQTPRFLLDTSVTRLPAGLTIVALNALYCDHVYASDMFDGCSKIKKVQLTGGTLPAQAAYDLFTRPSVESIVLRDVDFAMFTRTVSPLLTSVVIKRDRTLNRQPRGILKVLLLAKCIRELDLQNFDLCGIEVMKEQLNHLLEFVKLSDCIIPEALLILLIQIESLKKLEILPLTTLFWTSNLNKLSDSLELIDIRYEPDAQRSNANEKGSCATLIQMIFKLPRLKSVNLSNLDWTGVTYICNTSPSIKTLDIQAKNIHHDVLQMIFRLPGLESVNLIGLDWTGITSISDISPSIKRLHIQAKVVPTHVLSQLFMAAGLETISLPGCDLEGFDPINATPTLKEIKLESQKKQNASKALVKLIRKLARPLKLEQGGEKRSRLSP